MDNELVLIECVSYFKNNPGFIRVFEGMRRKYISLGVVGGTILLQRMSFEEKQALSGFLRKDYSHKANASIKLSGFQKALDTTKFKGIRMEDVLSEYFKEKLIPNSQAKFHYEENRTGFFNTLKERFALTPGGAWLEAALSQKEYSYKALIQRYDSKRDGLVNEISVVCDAINRLPYIRNLRTRLPVFASAIAADPHALDADTVCGQLFIHALAFHLKYPRSKNASERAELLYKAGILIDEVSNWVLCFGLTAYDKDGQIHSGWKGFFDSCEPMQATLLNLSNLSKVTTPSGVVYVVENPSVFSSIFDKLRSLDIRSSQSISLVCTYGQINLAGLVLLDLLAASCSEIWYSGDFDPEGIIIADKLKSRFGNILKLWRYSCHDYHAALSNLAATPLRIKKLESVKSPQLMPLVEDMKEKRLCGYQEMILDKLMEDIL